MITYTVTTLLDGGADDFGGGNLAAETADGGGLSLREALALAQNGDTVEFDPLLSGGTITLASGEVALSQNGLLVDGDIDGSDEADITIDAGDVSRIFAISNLGNVTLNGLALVNGYSGATNSGGAIFNGGDLNFYNGSIHGSNADYFGSAIFNGGDLSIDNSSFTNNNGTYTGAIDSYSGGVLNISNSYFGYNTTGGNGGAVAIGSNDTVTITNTYFFMNSSESNGGAVCSFAAPVYGGSLAITNSSFVSNSTTSGGALYVSAYGYASILESSFNSNIATNGGGIFLGYAGTLYDTGSYIGYNAASTMAAVSGQIRWRISA